MVRYMAMRGCRDLAGFFTLGTTRGDAWLGVEGDNSVVMLLMGIFAWIILAAFVCIYCGNVRDTYRMQKRIEQGRSVLSFREEAAQLLDKKFYVTVLALPVIGVFIFQILPVLFMILIAFTNYGGDIVPRNSWTGWDLQILKTADADAVCTDLLRFWDGMSCGRLSPLHSIILPVSGWRCS